MPKQKNDKPNIIKDPYVKTYFADNKQFEDFMECCDPNTGYKYFMDNFFYIQHPTRGAMQYHPYDYQEELIDTYHNYRYAIALMGRQMGKTVSAAGYLLWYAMFVPDSTILIAANKMTSASEIMTRVRFAYENCPDHIRSGVTAYNKFSIEFENGSRIVSATTTLTTGRGMSISLLYLDEFAFVPPTIAKEFWTSISATLATGGKCIITSTPNSDEDQFAELWHAANKTEDAYGNQTEVGVNGFRAYKATWDQHPERDDAWGDQMRAQLGEDRFRREMNCEFLIADETLISSAALIQLQGIEPIERTGQVRWYEKPKSGELYLVALDPSVGTGGDPAGIQIYSGKGTSQVGEWKHNKTPIPEQIKLLSQICKYIAECTGEPNNIYYSIENNGAGEGALISLAEYGESNIPGAFMSEPGKKRKGFATTSKNKLAACTKFKTLVESKKLKVRSKSLISELKTFVAREGSYAAKVGETDDLVMSSLLIIRMMQQLSSYDVELEDTIRDHTEYIPPLPFFAIIR